MFDIEQVDKKSFDVTAEKRRLLASIFPEAIVDGERIDFDRLRLALGESIEVNKERYGLNWPGKAECFKTIQKPSMATLLPVFEKSLNFEIPGNLIIEGDNLEVLKLLQKSHLGRIKLIYIDPPYNSGSDLIYPDNYSESLQTYLRYSGQIDDEGKKFSTNTESDGRFHSKWLCMMYSRLYLARNLLRDDGLIIISIDDEECMNLRLLCDEVFGQENFGGTFVVNSTPNARDYGHIAKMHEYALLYSKNCENTKTFLIPSADKSFRFTDEIGPFNIHPLYNSNTAFHRNNRPNLYYPFYLDPQSKDENGFYKISLTSSSGAVEIYPPKSQKEQTQFVWRWGKPLAQENLNKEIIGYRTEDGTLRIVQKMRHNSKIIRSLLTDNAYSTRRGTAEIGDLLGEKIFSFPKPIQLIKDFCRASTEGEDLILDFFAGSGTTGHAVLDLNEEDGGSRKFILVQLPEKTESKSFPTITDICIKRISKVIENVKAKDKHMLTAQVAQNKNGFRFFRLAESNIKTWNTSDANNADNLLAELTLHVDHLRHDRTDLDIAYEVILKEGFSIASKVELLTLEDQIVYSIAEGAFLICLARDITLTLLKDLADKQPQRVLLLDAGFANNDQLKTNAIQIFRSKKIVLKTL